MKISNKKKKKLKLPDFSFLMSGSRKDINNFREKFLILFFFSFSHLNQLHVYQIKNFVSKLSRGERMYFIMGNYNNKKTDSLLLLDPSALEAITNMNGYPK